MFENRFGFFTVLNTIPFFVKMERRSKGEKPD